MCGRFLLDSDVDDILSSFKFINELDSHLKFSKGEIFPNTYVPCITQGKSLKLLKWGFPMQNTNRNIINARSESITSKTLFRNSIAAGRCIIPASSFYEWKEQDGRKIKYEISIRNSKMFSMAGLFNVFVADDDSMYTAFVIITTSANKEMSSIHPRMPVLFDKGTEEAWLFNEIDKKSDLSGILKPYKDGELKIVPAAGFYQTTLLGL
jgi:putative SOS response-associated peptidase YedK